MTTVDAWRAFSQRSPHASTIWLDRLQLIDDDTVAGLLSRVPPSRLSRIGREFTAALLAENHRRLLEERN